MSDTPKGFRRRSDGVLEMAPGHHRHTCDPGEAVMVHYGGESRLGCTERVWSRDIRCHDYMCGKRPKHDPDHNGNPTKCGIHSQEAKEKRAAKSDAKWQAREKEWKRKKEIQSLKLEALQLIRAIADGHNDPRSACAEWCERYTKALEGKS